MACKIPPPAFTKEKSYQRWKDEVEAWSSVVQVEKSKQALVLALSFPEGSEVRDYVFSDLDVESLKAEQGINILFQKLDLKYKKDEISEAYEAWKKFDKLTKEKEMTIDNYVTEFDKRWKMVKKHENQISSPILAFKLLDYANLDVRTQQIVLSDVDYNKKDEMYDSMKTALKKYCGRDSLMSCSKDEISIKTESIEIKSEPISSVEEVNVVGRGRGRYSQRSRSGRGGPRGGGQDRGYRNTGGWKVN